MSSTSKSDEEVEEDATYSSDFEVDKNSSKATDSKINKSNYMHGDSESKGKMPIQQPQSQSYDDDGEDVLAKNSNTNTNYEESLSDETKSTSSFQLSNAIEMYEKHLSRTENSANLSQISEIMRQLESMEKSQNVFGTSSQSKSHGHKLLSGSSKTSLQHSQDSTVASQSQSDTSGTLNNPEPSELDEIDDIIKKLESLEEAQNALENALNQSEAGASSTVSSPVARQARPVPKSRSLSSQTAKSQRNDTSRSQPISFRVPPVLTKPDVDTADEMSAISELNTGSKNNSSAELFKMPLFSISTRPSSGILKPTDLVGNDQIIPQNPVSQEKSTAVETAGSSRSQGSQQSELKQTEKIDITLRNEMMRQDTLIAAYQKEIEHLYRQMNSEKDKLTTREKEHAEETNYLKTEIATLKLSHLVPVLPSSPRLGQRGEVERLRDDLNIKSQQVMDQHREIARLNIENSQVKIIASESAKHDKSTISDEKEKEYVRNIRSLEKQVRTLQKLAFHKDNTSTMVAQASIPTKSGSKHGVNVNAQTVSTQTMSKIEEVNKQQLQQCNILEYRIAELENELLKADADAKGKAKEFQGRLLSLKAKYDARIAELENKLAHTEEKSNPADLLALEEMTLKFEKVQGDVVNLKLEVSRYKREIETFNKTSRSSQNTSRQDAGTLSLALKAFKVELGEKEKELIRCRKEIGELKRTNICLKREREKYITNNSSCLQHQISTNYARAKSDLTSPLKTRTSDSSATQIVASASFDSKKPSISSNAYYSTIQVLESTLEEERSEFEKILKEKTSIIDEQEKQLKNLERKFDKLDVPVNRLDSLDGKNVLLEEQRTRILAQNKVIETLKNHIASYNDVETELKSLRQEKAHFEFRIRALNQQLALAKNLNKPEHEILGELMEKVENLNSRYFYREKQINTLLNRLSLKSIGGAGILLSSQQSLQDESIPLYTELDKFCPPMNNIHLTDI